MTYDYLPVTDRQMKHLSSVKEEKWKHPMVDAQMQKNIKNAIYCCQSPYYKLPYT